MNIPAFCLGFDLMKEDLLKLYSQRTQDNLKPKQNIPNFKVFRRYTKYFKILYLLEAGAGRHQTSHIPH